MSKKEKNTRKKCSKCQKERHLTRDFYMSHSEDHADGRINVCKNCILEDLDTKNTNNLLSDEFIKKLQNVLLNMNRPYIHDVWVSSVEESQDRNREAFGVLIKNLNLNHRDKNWRDSEFAEDSEEGRIGKPTSTSRQDEVKRKHNLELNTKNEKDVLRLLGYDPFEHESEIDRPSLYNKLIDYLTEDVLEDGFKLSSVIELVKTFNQVDRINAAIATSKVNNLGALITAKEKILRVALNIAKENGIATGVSKKSGAGSGTFTGIMKQLSDYDFSEANVNLFDIETAGGIRQVAEISNESIMKQLSFDENDYTEMVREQKILIENFEKKAKKYEEENRLLRVELLEREEKEQELKNKIKNLEDRLVIEL